MILKNIGNSSRVHLILSLIYLYLYYTSFIQHVTLVNRADTWRWSIVHRVPEDRVFEDIRDVLRKGIGESLQEG